MKRNTLWGLLTAFMVSVFAGAMAQVDSSFSQRKTGTMIRLQHGDGFIVRLSAITAGACNYIKDTARAGFYGISGVLLSRKTVFAGICILAVGLCMIHPHTASAGIGGAVLGAGYFNMDYQPVQETDLLQPPTKGLPKIHLTCDSSALEQAFNQDTAPGTRYAQFHNDAEGYSLFFARQLEHIMTKLFWKVYPEYKATKLLDVNSEAGPGAQTITFRMYDRAGSFGLISNYANDLPRTSVKASEHITAIKSFGGSYGYNLDEIRAAKFANVPLEMMEATACRDSYEQMVNKIGFLARANDPTYGGLVGLVYQPNAIIARPAYGLWTTTNAGNATYMYQDLINAVALQGTLTNTVEMPDTLLLPFAEYVTITTTPYTLPVSGGGGGTVAGFTTVADYFLAHNPSVRNIEYVVDLAAVCPRPSTPSDMTTSTDVAVFYKRSADKLQYHIPQPFE